MKGRDVQKINSKVAIRSDSHYTVVVGLSWKRQKQKINKLGGQIATIKEAEAENTWY